MGIYVFKTKFLIGSSRCAADAADAKIEPRFRCKDIHPLYRPARQGGRPPLLVAKPASAPPSEIEEYWRDVGTIDAYWEASIDLTDVTPKLDIYERDWPIWSYAEVLPPAKFVHNEEGRRGSAVSSLVSGDCIVSGALASTAACCSPVKCTVNKLLLIRTLGERSIMLLPGCALIGREAQSLKQRACVDHGVSQIPEGTGGQGEDAR